MKGYFILIILVAASLIIAPVSVLSKSVSPAEEITTLKVSSESAETAKQDLSTVTVFLSKSEKTATVSAFEYVCGSVAAEMPLTYHDEALKAQAVACYTNALRLKTDGNVKSELDGADISDDSGTHQGYISIDERKEKWGDSYEKYEEKLEKIVNEVLGKAITYNNELCIAAFFAICSGTTETAETVWGSSVPYLVSVKSVGDTLSPSYLTTVTFTKSQFLSRIKALGASLDDTSDLSSAVKALKTSKAKTVISAKIGDKELSGAEIRSAFELKSACFTVACSKEAVTFKVSGYGHGVGMSQYGADYMARQGSTYDEILKHYYKSIEIKTFQ